MDTEKDIDLVIDVLNKVQEQVGRETVLEAFGRYAALVKNRNLVLVPCSGTHPENALECFGEIFHASKGVLNLSTAEFAVEEFSKAIMRVKEKLSEKEWNQIYLATHGPSVLTAQIKLTVYRVLHVETVDLLYVDNKYMPVTINQTHLLRRMGND